jgi:catechol 2,3-dioxygenase-like lactoylglutathione lyase family enzyme
MDTFRVLQIDHVELLVPERYEAARWYQHTLGLEILPGFEDWAADRRGPLMISSDDGNTKLALFEGRPKPSAKSVGFHLLAFRVDADGFIAFLRRLPELQLTDDRDRLVTSGSVVDHDRAFSIYFVDPWGNRLELTTYDHEPVRAAVGISRRND